MSDTLGVKEDSRWPVAAVLGYGTLGTGSPAGRRYHRCSAVALTVLVGWMVLASNLPGSLFQTAMPFVPGIVFLYIAWEFRRYLLALDELARQIQFESLAWTYLSGLVLAIMIGGFATTTDWRVNPMWFVILEPIRAGFLYFVSRRY